MIRVAVQKLLNRGWQVVRLEHDGKMAFEKGWPTLTREARDFKDGDNVGVRFGPQSDGLVDLDLDYPQARQLIGRPAFGLNHLVEFGRSSLPAGQRGHRLVRCPDGPNVHRPLGIRRAAAKAAMESRGLGLTVLEVRGSNGTQTAFPPSVVKGDPLVWSSAKGSAANVPDMPWAELNRRAGLLAFCALSAALFPGEGREDYCRALFGTLVEAGVAANDADAMVVEVAALAGYADASALWLQEQPSSGGLVDLLALIDMAVLEPIVAPWLGLQPDKAVEQDDTANSAAAPGEYTADQLRRMLAPLDPADTAPGYYDFRDLLFAAHHATGGDQAAREVFVEWAGRNPDYAVGERDGHGNLWTDVVRGLWNRARNDRDGSSITVGTILRALVDAGHHDVAREFVQRDAAAAFEDDVSEVAQAHTARYAPLKYSDLLALPMPRWLVDHWVTEGGLFTVFGAEKMFKSFIMLDLCLCIATGRDWHGIKVKKGRVKYVIGEGNARRFADRITAWRLHYKVAQAHIDANFRIVPVRVGVDNPADLKAFLAADHSDYDLAVVDTVARNMDGDENATRDMNIMVKGADRIREVHHSAVGLVHHSGKDISKGARGSSALTGAVDAIIHVTKNKSGQSVVTLRNARDSESGAALVFEPHSVIVSDFEDDEVRSSLVMRFVRMGDEDDANAPEEADALSTPDRVLVKLAEENGAAKLLDLVDGAEHGMSRANIGKAVRRLVDAGLVEGKGPYFCTPMGIEKARELGADIPEKTELKGLV